MPVTAKAGAAPTGPQRASDFNDSLVLVPGFDAMLFVVRYAQDAQNTLRKCEYEELTESATAVGQILHDIGFKSNRLDDEWPKEAEDIRKEAEGKLNDYPDVAKNFKAFVMNARAAGIAVNAFEAKK